MLEKLQKGVQKGQTYQEKGVTDGVTLEDVGEALKGFPKKGITTKKRVSQMERHLRMLEKL